MARAQAKIGVLTSGKPPPPPCALSSLAMTEDSGRGG